MTEETNRSGYFQVTFTHMWHSRKYYSSDVFTLLQILRCQGRACRTQDTHDAHSLLYSHPIKSDQSIFAEPITLNP